MYMSISYMLVYGYMFGIARIMLNQLMYILYLTFFCII